MGHSVTLGGDRVGSGNKNKIYLHNYERSTHNLSEKFITSMGAGMLIPFMCKLATRDDKFEIDLNAGLRTIPTKGPLFGSFKLQLDVYQCPLRLYQALLHNNPLAIGLKANQVKFPKMRLYSGKIDSEDTTKVERMAATNSLVKYLGISGIGSAPANKDVYRDMFASGLLAYYDIFKNYYANKQEEYAYTLGIKEELAGSKELTLDRITHAFAVPTPLFTTTKDSLEVVSGQTNTWYIYLKSDTNIKLEDFKNITMQITYENTEDDTDTKSYEDSLYGLLENVVEEVLANPDGTYFTIKLKGQVIDDGDIYKLKNAEWNDNVETYEDKIELEKFKLSNIDDMRMNILSFHQLGESFILDPDVLFDPYYLALGDVSEKFWQKPLSGICVKTYQSDLFNNWINTEWIDGENGIAAITAISTSDGKITIDALNFSEKLYNLLNRIAVSGATYEDYLDAAYTDSAKKFCEAPMWIGGMSDEIVFEEIVQTAPAEGDPLGSLGGRGNLLGKKKGGKITCKIDEPSLIIGIVSITPRIVYTQGNEFFNTEIDSLQDIHVPALDGIAFQNLLEERLHAGATKVNDDGAIEERGIVGKVPAWIEYMTSVDKAYGDFAETDGKGYMVLQRDYLLEEGVLKDATTYIDPAKYNYAFAYTERGAQNFWVSIHSNIKARRLMSAKQIPNV